MKLTFTMLPGLAFSPVPAVTTVRCVLETLRGALIVTLGVVSKSPVTFTESDAAPLFTHAALTLDGEALGVVFADDVPEHPASAMASTTAETAPTSRRERKTGTAELLGRLGLSSHPPPRDLGRV